MIQVCSTYSSNSSRISSTVSTTPSSFRPETIPDDTEPGGRVLSNLSRPEVSEPENGGTIGCVGMEILPLELSLFPLSAGRSGTVGKLIIGDASWAVMESSSFGKDDGARDGETANVDAAGRASRCSIWRWICLLLGVPSEI